MTRELHPARLILALSIAGAFLGSACKRTGPLARRTPDPPHVSTADTAPTTPDVADAGESSTPFAPRQSSPVSGDGRTITVSSVTLTAPASQRFGASITVDLDGDGAATDIAATVLTSDGTRSLGLGLWSASGGAYSPLSIAHDVTVDPRCTQSTLRLGSPRSLSITWTCPDPPLTSDAGALSPYTQLSALVSLNRHPAVRATATVARTNTPERELRVSLDGADLDSDGTDELVVTATLGPATLREVYFDRAGVLTRDLTEPTASIDRTLALARRALSRGRRGAPEALSIVANLAMLRRNVCAEQGLSRLRFRDTDGVSCGGSPAFARATETELRALIALGEAPGAWALTRPEFAGDDGPVALTTVERDLTRVSTPERGFTAVHGPFIGTPLDVIAPGRRGALAFDLPLGPPAVMLRGLTTGRVDLASMTFAPGPEGNLDDVFAHTPDGGRVLGLSESCNGLIARVCPAGGACNTDPSAETDRWGGGTLPSLTTAVRCKTDIHFATRLSPYIARVLGANSAGIVVAFRGRLFRVTRTATTPIWLADSLGEGYGPGGAVSSNGRWVVLAGIEGLWVRDGARWKLRAPAALSGRTAQFTDQTITDDGAVIAGLVGTQAWVIRR